MKWLPTFDVMMTTVFLKSTVRPLPSVSRPSSSSCSMHVQHFGMRLFDLVEEHDGVRPPAHGFGELAGLLVADVPGGAPISRETVCFSWYSDMSMRIIACSSSNRNSASARASSVLPTPVGPEEDEAAERPVRILQAGARAANRIRHRDDRVVLADDALVQPLLHLDELLHLAFHQPADRECASSARRPRRCLPRRPVP